jgi:hypothetical protein
MDSIQQAEETRLLGNQIFDYCKNFYNKEYESFSRCKQLVICLSCFRLATYILTVRDRKDNSVSVLKDERFLEHCMNEALEEIHSHFVSESTS